MRSEAQETEILPVPENAGTFGDLASLASTSVAVHWARLAAASAGAFAVLGLSAYCGGTGLALVFVVVIAVAVALSAVRDVAAHTAVLVGFTMVLGWLLCLVTIGFPILSSIRLTRSRFFTSQPMNFTAWEYRFNGSLELDRWVVVGAILFPAVAATAWMVSARSRGDRRLSTRGLPALAGVLLLACMPLLAAAWLKSSDPYRLLAPTMGGDGRNFLLHTQRLRVDSKYENIVGVLSQGDFGPSLSAIISKASGARGLFQISDQYSIAATYLLSASVIIASMVHIGIQMAVRMIAPQRLRMSVALALAVVSALLGGLLASNQWTMNEVFRSGFFSLYIAFALTSMWAALQLAMNTERAAWWVCISIVLVLLFCTYQPAAVLPGLVSAGYAAVAIWPLVRARWRLVGFGVGFVALLVGLSGVVPAFIARAQRRVMVPGSISDTSDWFLIALIPLGVGLMLLANGVVRRIAVVLVSIPFGTWMLFWFFTRTREARGETSIGYYGAKYLYLSLFLALICVASAFLYLLALASRKRITEGAGVLGPRFRSLTAPAGVIILGLGATMLASQAGPTSTILTRSRTGWNQPSARIAREVFGHWNSTHAAFLQIADPGNDRMANFWSPLSWTPAHWAWAYGALNYDPSNICAQMTPGPVTVVTGSQEYADSLKAECPDVFDNIEVLR